VTSAFAFDPLAGLLSDAAIDESSVMLVEVVLLLLAAGTSVALLALTFLAWPT